MNSKHINLFLIIQKFCKICFFMTSIAIIVRMDAYAILYGIWLGLFLRLKRETIRKIWAIYFVFLLVLLPIQYIWCLGLPPKMCYGKLCYCVTRKWKCTPHLLNKKYIKQKEYPWSRLNQVDPYNIYNKIRIWLFLPDYSNPPDSKKLMADFFQVFFVWLQMFVFNIESDMDKSMELGNQAGTNKELVYEIHPYRNNPFRDFVSETKTVLDKIKYGIYMYSYWIVLAIVYLTGTSRISVLCMGYVILSFFFLWLGQTFLVKPLDKLLKLWVSVIIGFSHQI